MNTQPIHVFAKWQVKPAHLETVLGLLPEVVHQSTSEKGNLFYQIHQDNADPNVLILFEGYTDETALQDHRDSHYFQNIVIAQIVPLLEKRELNLTTPMSL
ncbi:hypothetical protein PBAL39_23067 [Pedobacter sp. BAL39]|uniref:putative quinol monooxygenase n=1 Tax=Pedobacter sp. BAL39 TaxID=391596 RepID=UPI0001559D28|nr:putative quinol monooxygenase [Pedobacter sp. BAL39]EDM35939.1 hypothetical protein PBAL39_23067 [Pedobacter sp. BAL39]